MCKWLKTNSDAIQAGSAIVGVAVTIIGFGLTIYQLSSANHSLQASNTYTIQHDAREIISGIISRGNLRPLLMNTLPAEKKEDAKTDLWQMLNFYLSVFRQLRAGGINEKIGAAFATDFCDLLDKIPVTTAWDELRTEKRITEDYEEMRRTWCGQK
ncbi:hypothetical protein [Mesorhizobium sp.]|uniref:hypothetical protein n=1 Tax=Mesorhizobium sp. TaxID=1871066 RepID=UPI000FE783A3|nr:hypothetical protein [Mesorhizobium sp.]RWP11020.1 MAG: hypothetical protein EOQ97_11315 [Mesorhizobium sp.]